MESVNDKVALISLKQAGKEMPSISMSMLGELNEYPL